MFIPLHDQNALKHIRLQYVTLVIIAANVLIWLAIGTPAITGQEAYRATVYGYGFIPAVVNGYEVLPAELETLPPFLTYFSYAFFHGDFMHLAGNMLFIWVFGDNIEDALGHFKFFVFYLASAAAGAWLHAFADPQSSVPLIGASGAAAGIVAAYILLHPKMRVWVLALGKIPLRIPAIFVLGAWIAFQVFQFVTDVGGQVSWAAHIGGIIAGAILLFVLKRPGVQLFDRQFNAAAPQPVDVPGEHDHPVETARTATPKPVEANDPNRPVDPKRAKPRSSVPSAGDKSNRRWGRQ